ncbi:hypothetical protein [Streptomyces coeruleorubidus]|uniref:hypothetical protein n=1 Tax=Streptomyces coeruleorubidus TaxID=116188 RepID=UPI0037B71B0B
MAEKNNCRLLAPPARDYCEQDTGGQGSGGGGRSAGDGITDGATDRVEDLANILIKKINGLIAPKDAWAPEKADSGLYEPFRWLGQHLAVAIFVCVVVVCALTAWQGAPRLRQMGASTGWALVAVACMASVPGAVMLLNEAVAAAFTATFDSNTGTLFGAIREDLKTGADSGNPLAILLIISALVVALAFAALVFITRQLGILAFVCLAPLVLASLARGGDMTAVKAWALRLLGLMFAPFALLLISPFVEFAQGSLVVDTILLVAADALMVRMIFHGVPYFGPKVAGAARALVERHTDIPLARAAVRVGAPTVYEQENTPRAPRTVDTPGRAMSKDRGVLLAAYGLKPHQRAGRLTTQSAVTKATRDESDRAARTTQIRQARQQARATVQTPAPTPTPNPVRNARPTPARPGNP